jgi:hypothetical protein
VRLCAAVKGHLQCLPRNHHRSEARHSPTPGQRGRQELPGGGTSRRRSSGRAAHARVTPSKARCHSPSTFPISSIEGHSSRVMADEWRSRVGI